MVHSLMLYRIERSYTFGDFTSSDSIMLVHLFAVPLVTMTKSAVTTVKRSRQSINCYKNRVLYLLANALVISIKRNDVHYSMVEKWQW